MAKSQSGLVAKRYATALLEMSGEAKVLEKVEKDLADLKAMISQSADLRKVLGNPLINRETQKKALAAIAAAANFQKVTTNFLGVVAHNRRLGILPVIIDAFVREMSARRGEVHASVQTAFALTPAQTDALQKELSKAMGSNVTLNVAVERDLLGGMIVTVGSLMIDDSIKRKLERLKRVMSAGKAA